MNDWRIDYRRIGAALAFLLVVILVVAAWTIPWVAQWVWLTVLLLGLVIGVGIGLDALAWIIAYWRVRRDARRRNPGEPRHWYHAHYDPIGTGKIKRKGRGEDE